MLFVVEIDLAFGTEDKIIFAESIVWLRSREDWNEVVFLAELHQLGTIVFVDGSDFVDEQSNLVVFA
jgi:hypothetical protein